MFSCLSVIPHGSGFVLYGGDSLQWHDQPGATPRWKKVGYHDQVAPFDSESFVAGLDASVVRVSIESGEEIWRVRAPEEVPRYLRVHAAGPYVVAGGDSWAYCIAGASGKVLWSTTGKVLRSSPYVRREDRSPEAARFSPEQGLLLVALNRTSEAEIIALRSDTWATVWSHVLPMDAVEFLLEGDRAFIGNYESISIGAALVCVDIKEGHQLWKAPAQSISVDHFSYSNKVRLFRRENWISLIGCADAGDYVETFNADTGEVISRWRSADGLDGAR
jgi:outer membrane protein assembly factor BamB